MTTSAVRAGGYDPERITAGGVTAEVARLEAQAALTFAEELRILLDLGLADAGPLVDLGCGTGAVTRRIRSACPRLPVLGLDSSLTMISRAAPAGLHQSTLPLACATTSALPLRSGSVGSVLLRYVVQHLSDPAVTFAEARRVLRPGGLLAVVEVDAALWGLAQPLVPGLEAVHRKAAAARRDTGTNRLAGRDVPRQLRGCGFTDIVVRPFGITNDQVPTADFAVHLGPDQFVPLVSEGALSLADLSLAARGWERFRSDPDAWVLVLGLIIAGRAPGGPGRD